MATLIGGDFPPYQAVCGKKPICGKGKLFNHGRAADAKVPVYQYKTTVTDPCGGAPVAPYERYQNNPDGCDRNACGSNCEAPCFPFQRPFPASVWLPDGTDVDYSLCHKIGWKSVQAMRYWNGRGSYYSSGSDNLLGCEPGPPNIVQWRSYQALPERGKYRTITVSAEWSGPQFDFTLPSPFYTTVNAHCNYTQTLDQYSGVFRISGWSFSPNAYDPGATEQVGNSNQAIFQASYAYWYLSDAISRFTTILSDTGSATVTYSSGGITVSVGGQNEEVITWSIDILGTSQFDRYLYDFDNLGNPVLVYEEHCTMTSTTITYGSTAYAYGCFIEPLPAAIKTIISVTGTLSDAVSDTAIYNDVKDNLLSTWNLADDKQHPWRKDRVVGVAPLVTRDEIQFSDWSQPVSWVAKDYGAPVANGPNSFHGSTNVTGLTMPDPDWDGITGVVVSGDVNSGSAEVAVGMDTFNGDTSFDGHAVGSPFPCGAPTSYALSGTLPPGVSFDAATGIFHGTVSGLSDSRTWRYGVTIAVTGPPCATGNIIGAPLPAGYQNQWDWYFTDYRGCCCDDHPELCGTSTGWSWYRYGWGTGVEAYNLVTGCQLPLNATHWTNWWEAINKPVGAWLFYNDQTQFFGAGGCDGEEAGGAFNANALWACKYAEILDVWPSQDIARPGVADKFSFDEQNPVYCAANLSGSGPGSTWTITAFDGSTPSSPTFSGVWGGPVVGGFYNVALYSGGVLTLGSKVWNCPSDWTSAASGDDTGSCFGKLRFASSPSFLGRAGVTVSGGTLTWEIPQTTFGMDAASSGEEQIDLYDVEMNLLASNVTAKRDSDSTFHLISGSYPNAAWVTIHGAPAWYMHDNRPKGYYGYLTFMSDFRSQGEAGRLAAATDCSGSPVGGGPTTNNGGGPLGNLFAAFGHTNDCLPFKRCSPRVVCISPNGETFDNGVRYDFPVMLGPGVLPTGGAADEFYFDQDYGSKWWGYVQATMTDLLWQPPHPPCGYEKTTDNGDGTTTTETLVWGMDDGSCTGPPPSGGGVECDPAATAAPDCDVTTVDGSGNTTITHHKFYAHAPQVEPRFAVPCDYGVTQSECAPALPAGIQIGWSSPVTATTGDIAMPPLPTGFTEEGAPGLANMAFWLHYLMCQTLGTGCRFNYPVLGC